MLGHDRRDCVGDALGVEDQAVAIDTRRDVPTETILGGAFGDPPIVILASNVTILCKRAPKCARGEPRHGHVDCDDDRKECDENGGRVVSGEALPHLHSSGRSKRA